jgi:antitoxin CptB
VNADVADDAELRRLRWRCRRGMRELDQLMLRYLDRCWAQAEAAERAHFTRLLATEDDQLWRWCMGREVCGDPELDAVLTRILALAP